MSSIREDSKTIMKYCVEKSLKGKSLKEIKFSIDELLSLFSDQNKDYIQICRDYIIGAGYTSMFGIVEKDGNCTISITAKGVDFVEQA